MTHKPLILVSNDTQVLQHDPAPRLDYVEIANTLTGDLMGYDLFKGQTKKIVRAVEQRLKLDVTEASAAFRRLPKYDIVLSLSEKVGIPLAVLLQLSNRQIPHYLVAHKLSSGLKTRLFKLGLHKSLTGIICVSRKQTEYAIQTLEMPTDKVHFVYDKVDQHFFCPTKEKAGDFILAVGQEQRDYMTLLKALAGTSIKLVVVASSPWSTSQLDVKDISNVQVLNRIPFTELRDLYAQARLAVVPLHNVDYAAGVNGLLEAMAMGKATIVTKTDGIVDYVEDQQTAIYTPPADVNGLRERILVLWNDDLERNRLGENARQLVVEGINMDQYVQSIQKIILPDGN